MITEKYNGDLYSIVSAETEVFSSNPGLLGKPLGVGFINIDKSTALPQ